MPRELLIAFALVSTIACGSDSPRAPGPPAPDSPNLSSTRSLDPDDALDRLGQVLTLIQDLQRLVSDTSVSLAERKPAIQVAASGVDLLLREGDRFLPRPFMDRLEDVVEELDRTVTNDEEIPAALVAQIQGELDGLLGEMQSEEFSNALPFPMPAGGWTPPVGSHLGGPVPPGPRAGPGPPMPMPGGPPGVEFGGELEESEAEIQEIDAFDGS